MNPSGSLILAGTAVLHLDLILGNSVFDGNGGDIVAIVGLEGSQRRKFRLGNGARDRSVRNEPDS